MARHYVMAASTIAACLVGALLGVAEDKKAGEEGERSVKQADVPANALAGLKKIAGDASITEFAEEIEHGHKFYEGSWKGPDGKVDTLVTEAGDVVEIEESLPSAKIPAAVCAAAEKVAGNGATFERKTLYLYEIHFKKDGKNQERVFTADAREYKENGQASKGNEDDGAEK